MGDDQRQGQQARLDEVDLDKMLRGVDRGFAIDEAKHGNSQDSLVLRGWVERNEYGGMDDHWDEDGDSIQLVSKTLFRYHGSPLVEACFPKETDLREAARFLRKMAMMAEHAAASAVLNSASEQLRAKWVCKGCIIFDDIPQIVS